MSRRRVHVLLDIEGTCIVLYPDEEVHLTTTLNVGHKAALAIVFLDQNGNPMLTPQAADATPSWTHGSDTVDKLVPSADGLTCEVDATAEGSDVIGLSLSVGGKSFSATLNLNVTPEPQVLTSVAINATVE